MALSQLSICSSLLAPLLIRISMATRRGSAAVGTRSLGALLMLLVLAARADSNGIAAPPAFEEGDGSISPCRAVR